MRRRWKAWGLALVATVAVGGIAEAKPVHHHHRSAGRMDRHGFVGAIEPGHVYSKSGHYVALVGDPGSGLGFYPLPYQYRVGAWRYRFRNAPPPWALPPTIAAAQAQAVRSYGWGDDPTPADAYQYGVYNPIDGVGTPFFAGYYGPADPDEAPSILGHPYH